MSCRKIKSRGTEYINKVIELSKSNIEEFPCLAQLSLYPETVHNSLVSFFESNKCSQYEAAAIAQQYNEFYVWSECMCTPDSMLIAPIVEFFADENTGLPILTFPKFEPLIKSDDFYQYNYEEGIAFLGHFCAKKNISYNTLRNFLIYTHEFCDHYNLNSDDILGNLSNLGWSDTFGLRIIDYGLANSSNKTELLF